MCETSDSVAGRTVYDGSVVVEFEFGFEFAILAAQERRHLDVGCIGLVRFSACSLGMDREAWYKADKTGLCCQCIQ